MENSKIIITEDGSHTVLDSRIAETYHSENGAINESQHVFIQNGLSQIEKDEINILEIGFGTGLNALLTCQFAIEHKKKINYLAIEKFPLKQEIIQQLNYPEKLNIDKEVFLNLHSSEWNKLQNLNLSFGLNKQHFDLLDYDFSKQKNIDLVYFDAFSPSKQPELWTANIFEQLYRTMSNGGLLTTYSSAGIVKRALRAVGFNVKRKPGPKGKFHMLNAFKLLK
ncbi:MAG: SAM-dependent methyltransferase [Bacteroidetes bacterium]|nr:MAG: SAM-dependent methyltransferase [Bacteroidota bacterium]RLD82199.1 MAG: SAM-dependent methyltransferase [Bacteroidota bacterium]